MKKIYTEPTITETIVVTNEIIATSIPVGGDVESGVTGANQHRGEWGNLWK